MQSRRLWLGAVAGLATSAFSQSSRIRATKLELLPVKATERTVWLFVRVSASNGMTGLGEASDGFGFARTTKEDAARMETELRSFFELVQGFGTDEIEAFRRAAFPRIRKQGLLAATAFSSLEQAMWDLGGQIEAAPVHRLLRGRAAEVRRWMPAYANINRSVTLRQPQGFAQAALAAVKDGFRHLKLAPFDGLGKNGVTVESGIASIAAVREAVGSEVGMMVDCHSLFDVRQAIDVAAKVEPYKLSWYEEPVAPEQTAKTAEIKRAIRQRMAGGEILFSQQGFAALSGEKAVDVIMPDVKHCGGLREFGLIADDAARHGVQVSPHNPSGPVSTVASAQACAAIPNFEILEVQWGEVPWRPEVIDPPEAVVNGRITTGNLPGLGIRLNEQVVRAHLL